MTGVRIALNGEPYDLPEPMSILALLERLNVDPRTVAVELNRVVVRRQRYAETRIAAGAEVEIVSFVGGGSAPAPEARRDQVGSEKPEVGKSFRHFIR